jgi:hypothetical protein
MTKQEAQRGIEILAKSVFRDLKQAGYGRAEVVAFASSSADAGETASEATL